jgi:hypothetical protein
MDGIEKSLTRHALPRPRMVQAREAGAVEDRRPLGATTGDAGALVDHDERDEDRHGDGDERPWHHPQIEGQEQQEDPGGEGQRPHSRKPLGTAREPVDLDATLL